ncbi:MAG: phosphopantetheine-binding protein [Candidatus Cloacimonadaceae bacterium]|nr:phosphopantetheine-binding protein [Candidatus Cloacimonadaceae bacterium]
MSDNNTTYQQEPTEQLEVLEQQREYSTLDRVKYVLSMVTERPVDKISNGHVVASLIEDSLQHVLLVIALEEQFNIELTIADTVKIRTVSNLSDHISRMMNAS